MCGEGGHAWQCVSSIDFQAMPLLVSHSPWFTWLQLHPILSIRVLALWVLFCIIMATTELSCLRCKLVPFHPAALSTLFQFRNLTGDINDKWLIFIPSHHRAGPFQTSQTSVSPSCCKSPPSQSSEYTRQTRTSAGSVCHRDT